MIKENQEDAELLIDDAEELIPLEPEEDTLEPVESLEPVGSLPEPAESLEPTEELVPLEALEPDEIVEVKKEPELKPEPVVASPAPSAVLTDHNEAEEASMELTLGISEILNAFQGFMKGDYSLKVNEDSNIEALAQLQKITNMVIAQSGSLIGELETSVNDFSTALQTAESGDLSVRVEKEYSHNRLQKLKELINTNLANSEKRVEESNDASMELALGLSQSFEILKKVSEGDFDVNASEDYKTELLSQLGKVINYTVSNLSGVINQIKKTVTEITSYSTEISSTNEEIVNKAREEIKIVSEASTSVSELTASIQQVANNADNVYQNSEKSLGTIKESNSFINDTISKMRRTTDVIDDTSKSLSDLQNNAQEIQDILNIINKISEKIDLLALNAAIEASSVGESGRRFRVVADEMRKLADNSMKSSRQIENVLTNIKHGIEDAGTKMKSSVNEVDTIMNALDTTGGSMNNIVKVFEDSSNLMKEVSISTNQQVKATDMFSNIIDQINIAATETVQGIENAKTAIENFIDISVDLKDMSDKFKLPGDSTPQS